MSRYMVKFRNIIVCKPLANWYDNGMKTVATQSFWCALLCVLFLPKPLMSYINIIFLSSVEIREKTKRKEIIPCFYHISIASLNFYSHSILDIFGFDSKHKAVFECWSLWKIRRENKLLNHNTSTNFRSRKRNFLFNLMDSFNISFF